MDHLRPLKVAICQSDTPPSFQGCGWPHLRVALDMDFDLRTELKHLLRRDLAGGPHRSVEQALCLLQAQQAWIEEHRAENDAKGPEESPSQAE